MSARLDAQARRAASALHRSAEGVDPFSSLHDLRRVERRRARAAVARLYLRRTRRTAARRGRKLAGLAAHALARPPVPASTAPPLSP